ncbi:MAG: hypothetical protein KGL46_08555 [Hyphomicrobiales bacterium]|nr:hypothetical protein [Hyphomicrobiales bacterium]
MMGGPPLAVLARLVFVSLVVGALLMWLNIRPYEVFWAIQRMIDRLWLYGWDSLRQIADYIAAGAVLVVPVWLVLRIFNARGAR